MESILYLNLYSLCSFWSAFLHTAYQVQMIFKQIYSSHRLDSKRDNSG